MNLGPPLWPLWVVAAADFMGSDGDQMGIIWQFWDKTDIVQVINGYISDIK